MASCAVLRQGGTKIWLPRGYRFSSVSYSQLWLLSVRLCRFLLLLGVMIFFFFFSLVHQEGVQEEQCCFHTRAQSLHVTLGCTCVTVIGNCSPASCSFCVFSAHLAWKPFCKLCILIATTDTSAGVLVVMHFPVPFYTLHACPLVSHLCYQPDRLAVSGCWWD